MEQANFSVVVACTLKNGIGFDQHIPWRIPEDLRVFRATTEDGVVVMGRLTYDSLPSAHRPLKKRVNVVVSRTLSVSLETKDAEEKDAEEKSTKRPKITDSLEQVTFVPSLDAALLFAAREHPHKRVFVIGGAHLYAAAFNHPCCTRLYVTRVLSDLQCNIFMPPIDSRLYEVQKVGTVQIATKKEEGELDVYYLFQEYVRRHEEWQYLDLAREILNTGNDKMDRTETGTFSLFGRSLRFNLRGGRVPLLTTKRVFWRGVVEELLWMLRGETDAKILSSKGVKIWDKDGAATGGDLGPTYGHQWRHFGARYINCNTSYHGQGSDQIVALIRDIRENPHSRRHLVSAWNPADTAQMALPPCHVLSQFYVFDGHLSCLMYQRSCDLAVGAPFNIASYAFLTHLLARLTGLLPGDFVYDIGDVHVYKKNESALRLQLEREPREFASLKLPGVAPDLAIEKLTIEHFKLQNYDPHPPIQFEMMFKAKVELPTNASDQELPTNASDQELPTNASDQELP